MYYHDYVDFYRTYHAILYGSFFVSFYQQRLLHTQNAMSTLYIGQTYQEMGVVVEYL